MVFRIDPNEYPKWEDDPYGKALSRVDPSEFMEMFSRPLKGIPPMSLEHLSRFSRQTSLFEARQQLVMDFSWPIPCKAALRGIAEFVGDDGIIEVCAGTGYWAHLLGKLGVDVIATDIEWHPVRWAPVDRLDCAVAAGTWPERALMLSWPPYAEPQAYKDLRAYLRAGGTKLIYIGEGDGGCTGDDKFHRLLYKTMDEVAFMDIPVYYGINDDLRMYVRKTAASSKKSS
jgi:hypothetical protein